MSVSAGNPLAIDVPKTTEMAVQAIRHFVHNTLHKQGAVVAVSGGIDSSVCAALCTLALGRDHVLALSLPDRHSSASSSQLASQLCANLGIELLTESIDPLLAAAGCYRHQTESLQAAFPDYVEGWSFKITLPSLLGSERLNLPRVTVKTSDGQEVNRRISPQPYLQLVASTNFKQRSRTMIAYYHADRLNYGVCGTPNRLEYDQGFFVRGGDGLSDFAPIAHLYKSQVFDTARALHLPEAILTRLPTTDTFPLEQTQEEFYFSASYQIMDLCLYGLNAGVPAGDIAARAGITVEQAGRIYRDIEAKRRKTLSLHFPPLKVEPVQPIDDRKTAILSEPIR